MQVERPPASKNDIPIYRPLCNPLRLDLELFRPEARIGTRYSLWHRATLTNEACYKIGDIEAKGLIQSWETAAIIGNDLSRADLRLRVWGPDGKDVPITPISLGSLKTFLYGDDNDELQRLMREGHLNKFWYAHLSPGESISSIPTILDPLEEVPFSGHATGDGISWKRVPVPKDAAIPPAGFKAVDGYIFKRPGQYAIRAEFDAEVWGQAEYPYVERLPKWIGVVMDCLYRLRLDFAPDYTPGLPRRYHVHVESKSIEFQVFP